MRDSMHLGELLERWIDTDTDQPLILIRHFAADIEPALTTAARIADRGRIRWIFGHQMLHRLNLGAYPATGPAERVALGLLEHIPSLGALKEALEELSFAEPTLFLTSFARVPPHLVFSNSSASAVEALLDFCGWAAAHQHRVIIGLPRLVLGLPGIPLLLKQTTWKYSSPTLFPAAQQNQEPDWMGRFDEELRPLFRANSRELNTSLARFVSTAKVPYGVGTIVELARMLTQEGFYEIAYRLELYCRGLAHRDDWISLDADVTLMPRPQDPEEWIKGLLSGAEKAPAIASRGILSGGPGSGKTTALLQIERFWSLHQINVQGANHPSWVPVRIEAGAEPLAEELRSQLQAHSQLQLLGERIELACHAVLARYATPLNLRWWFSSPVYFLFDSVDEVPRERRKRLEREVKQLQVEFPAAGLLLAFRTGNVSQFADFHYFELRPLSGSQFDQLLERKAGPPFLRELLTTHGKPISCHLRNPFLLTAIAQVARSYPEISVSGLPVILQRYVESMGQPRYAVEQIRAIVERWLPGVALEMRERDVSSIEGDPDRVEQARGMGILRHHTNDRMLQFRHELVRDFFAAKQLAKASSRHDVASEWPEVARILAGLLEGERLERFLEQLDPRLAQLCLLELTEERRRDLPAATAVPERLVHQMQSAVRWQDRREAAEALAFLDPRIFPVDPIRGTVRVPKAGGLQAFRVGRCLVTNLEFSRFIEDRGYVTRAFWRLGWRWRAENGIEHPRHWRNNELNRPNYPVVGVSLYEALAYCSWLSRKHRKFRFTLPTDLQWDRVAHGNNLALAKALHHFVASAAATVQEGKVFSLEGSGVAEFLSEVSKCVTRHQVSPPGPLPVGLQAPNKLGCYDLFGNVWEWCDAWLPVGPVRPSGTQREVGWPAVVKGGTQRGSASPVWTILGGWFDPYTRSHELGFRICAIRV